MNEEIVDKKKEGLWTRGFLLLFIVSMCEQTSFVSMRTVITPYAKNDLLIAASLLGLLSGMLSVASLFSRPIAGKLLGKMPHKRILLAATVCELVILTSYIFVKQFALLAAVRLLHGFFYGIANTAIIAMAGNSVKPSHMGNGMGIFGISQMIALGIAPTLSMAIYNNLGVMTLFVFTCVCTLLAFVFALLVPEPESRAKPGVPVKEGKKTKGLWGIFLPSALPSSFLNFFIQFSYASVSTFIIVYGEERQWAQVGLFYTVYAVGALIVRPLMGGLYDRKGLTPVVYLTSAAMIISIVILATTSSFAVFLISAMLLTIGFGGGWCVYQADAINCKDPADRGTASATYFAINDAGIFLGATVAGYVVDYVGYSNTFLLFIIPVGVSLTIYTIRLLLKKKRALQDN